MTRARSHTWAVGISPLIQPLLEAVLCVVVSLVQGVATTFGMIGRRSPRDWHTQLSSKALPQTKPDIHLKEQTFGPPGSRPAVDAQRRKQTRPQTTALPLESLSPLWRESLLATPSGLANDTSDAINRDSPRASGMTSELCV
jgi:hypothetical protein